MCKSLTNYFPRNNDFLVTYFGKTQMKYGLSRFEEVYFPVASSTTGSSYFLSTTRSKRGR